MRCVLVPVPGGLEAMRLADLPDPEPREGEVAVRVAAAGVNFIDVYHRTGAYRADLPVRLGLEGAGVVERVGPGVTAFREGDRVAWSAVAGSYASHVVGHEDRFVRVPDGVEPRVAAAAMLQGMTAHYLARTTYPLGPGDTCLVHAAAGGVGLLLCQMARRAGSRVIGTVSTAAKASLARDAGADSVVVRGETDFVAEARRLTAGDGVSVVYDSIGRDTFDGSLRCLRRRGMLVLYGQSSGPVPPLDPQVLAAHGSLFLTRPSLFHYTATREELGARAADVLGMVARGEIHVRIHAELPLADAHRAHEMLESGRTAGKLVLVP